MELTAADVDPRPPLRQHGRKGELGDEIHSADLRGGYELQPVATATSLRFTNGKPKTSDGPFAETKEQLGGYYIVEVDTLDQAIEWAERMPAMASGTIEIRPLGMGP